MKKSIYLLVLSCLCIVTNAQDRYGIGSMPINANGDVIFSELVQQDGNANELYSGIKSVFANLFESSKEAIQMDDKDSNTIIAKGNNRSGNTYIDFTVKVQTRDGRYKIDIYDCVYTAILGNGLPPTIWSANILTDDDCINKKGECKKTGKGFARRLTIDTKDTVISAIKNGMNGLNSQTNEDW